LAMYEALCADDSGALERALATPGLDINVEPAVTYRGRAWEFCRSEEALLRLLEAGLHPGTLSGLPESPLHERRTILHRAAAAGWLRVVDRVAGDGSVDINHVVDPEYSDGGTALAAAVSVQHGVVVAALVRHGANVNQVMHDGCTALARLLRYRENGDVPTAFVLRMLELGADASEVMLHLGALAREHMGILPLFLTAIRERLATHADAYISTAATTGSLRVIRFMVEDVGMPLATLPDGTRHGATFMALLKTSQYARSPPGDVIRYLRHRGAPLVRQIILSLARDGQLDALTELVRVDGAHAIVRVVCQESSGVPVTPALIHGALEALIDVQPAAAAVLAHALVAEDPAALTWPAAPLRLCPTLERRPATFAAAEHAPELLLQLVAAGAEADVVLQPVGDSVAVDPCDDRSELCNILDSPPRTLVEVLATGYTGFMAAPATVVDPLFRLAAMPFDATARHGTNAHWQHARRAAAVAEACAWSMRDGHGAPMTWVLLRCLLQGAGEAAWARRRPAVVSMAHGR